MRRALRGLKKVAMRADGSGDGREVEAAAMECEAMKLIVAAAGGVRLTGVTVAKVGARTSAESDGEEVRPEELKEVLRGAMMLGGDAEEEGNVVEYLLCVCGVVGENERWKKGRAAGGEEREGREEWMKEEMKDVLKEAVEKGKERTVKGLVDRGVVEGLSD